MSESFPEGQLPSEQEAIELPHDASAAFGALMDALAPDSDGAPASEGATAPAADAGAAGPAAGADQGAGAAASAAGEPAVGADGKSVVPPAGDPAPGSEGAPVSVGGDLPPEWTASAADMIPELGSWSEKIEESVAKGFHAESLSSVREEYPRYFAALETHPRMMVGQTVPAVGKEGEETLRDEADVRSWQDAVKTSLVEEVRDRTNRALEGQKDFLETIHASIELFQNNTDLIPGTREFDRELADRFATLAKPYELRVDGKLQGFSIPPQPLINQLRTDLTAARAAAAKAETPTQQQARDEQGRYAGDQPQAGLSSKAGGAAGAEGEDFSTLFGTLGMPGLRI